MEQKLKIVVMNPPSDNHLNELCEAAKELIQSKYYS